MADKPTYQELEQRVKELEKETIKRMHAEEALRDSEKRSRAWLEHSPACTKIVDRDFNLQFMSSAGIEDLKIDDITQFYGKPYPFYFYPESFRRLMAKNLEEAKETGKIIAQEASVVDIKGDELWFHSTLVPMNDDEGQFDYIIVVSIDTTERNQSEKALRESEERFRSTFEQAAVGIAHVALDGRFLRINQRFCDIVGYTPEEMLEFTFQDITYPDDLESDLEYVNQVLAD